MNDIVNVQEPIDPAEAAFARMQGELALLRRAIEAMAAERAGLEIPDYSATLGQIIANLGAMVKETGALADAPALQLTPQALAFQMEMASTVARRSDHDALTKASVSLTDAAGMLRGWVESARLANVQNWHLVQAGVAGLVCGAMLCATLLGAIANVVPHGRGGTERPPMTAAEHLGRPLLPPRHPGKQRRRIPAPAALPRH